MKKILLFANLLFFVNAYSQTKTITIKPDSTHGKDAVVFSRTDAKAKNYGKVFHNSAATWTWDNDGLGQGTFRSLIEFGLDTLPKGTVIKSATLKMYYTKAVKIDGNHESPNPSTLYRITQEWGENDVTWNNQPTIANTGIAIPTLTGTSNLEVDVTTDVQDMFANGASNFGWLLKNNSENPYVGILLASSDNQDYAKNPELILEVENCTQTIVLQPFNGNGIDNEVSSLPTSASVARNNVTSLGAYAWTWNSVHGTMRSFFKFDLANIPNTATVTDAKLTLFANYPNGTSDTQGHTNKSHSNESTMNRVLSSWNENTLTWNNQPSANATASVTLATSTSAGQNYTVNLTSDVADMVANPQNNFGWILKMKNEAHYSGLFFYSSDVTDQKVAPKLEITYDLCDNVTNVSNAVIGAKSTSVFPNPSASGVFEFTNEISGVVYSINGVEVAKIKNATTVDLSNQVKGIYIIKTENGNVFKVISK